MSNCQQHKYEIVTPAGLLQPLPIPDEVWIDISMDFIVGLPPCQGKSVIFVVVDHLSNYAILIQLLPLLSSLRTMCLSYMMSSGYHPQIDGQTEVVNRFWETYLRCSAAAQAKKWLLWLSWAEFSYNTAYHTSTKLTPFEVVYGRPPPTVTPYEPSITRFANVDRSLAA
ncbi:hypothetical protein L3X38_027788 [Prunus dulcis]|uniref:Integrase catalytic domain-containing protein n=1 Tax=Prunus dulcis TaxID=3755 RepID=A0AAD4VPG7_PRUDU|nr:hypothetical protein L3X38_027788 [Prunus dulcis]